MFDAKHLSTKLLIFLDRETLERMYDYAVREDGPAARRARSLDYSSGSFQPTELAGATKTAAAPYRVAAASAAEPKMATGSLPPRRNDRSSGVAAASREYRADDRRKEDEGGVGGKRQSGSTSKHKSALEEEPRRNRQASQDQVLEALSDEKVSRDSTDGASSRREKELPPKDKAREREEEAYVQTEDGGFRKGRDASTSFSPRREYDEEATRRPEKGKREAQREREEGNDRRLSVSNHKTTERHTDGSQRDSRHIGGADVSNERDDRQRDQRTRRRDSRDGLEPDGSTLDEAPPAVDKDMEAYAARKIKKVTAEDIGRAGGVYVPPFKLARLQQKTDDTKSTAYQRQICHDENMRMELFRENLVRGRGLFCRAIIRAQLASPGFTAVYAALLCIVNSKLPDIGELVIKRVILQFRRAYRRNDKIVCMACVEFFAHLVNQRVAHELLALQLCELLLQEPTNDSVEVCIGFLKAVGQVLEDVCKPGFDAAFERLRAILQQGETDKKTQYSIEALWDIRRNGFKDFPGVVDDLDLVEAEDKITHEVDLLDTSIKGEEMLNIFKAQEPDEYEANEKKWSALSKEILGEVSTGVLEDISGSVQGCLRSDVWRHGEQPLRLVEAGAKKQIQIKDMTDQDIVNLRKTIYLCIMSSLNAEECVHKILKMNIQGGRREGRGVVAVASAYEIVLSTPAKEDLEMEVAVMLIDCCAMERTFQRFFALQAERLAKLKAAYCECFQEAFKRQYALIRLIAYARFYSWIGKRGRNAWRLLSFSDAVPWSVLEVFELTEEATTSSGRIFLKVLLQDMSETLGIRTLNDRLMHPDMKAYIKCNPPFVDWEAMYKKSIETALSCLLQSAVSPCASRHSAVYPSSDAELDLKACALHCTAL
ncbi:cell cycle control protein [Cyclospora cayetanensis]|uniref:Cell cycle control protein n=1 Tax=Cyclospora cayetanensis TaxID=88456 RepID=A0A1D3D529_9EIME|nr:cell cycle control protein [Cyclospora cayetanensis]